MDNTGSKCGYVYNSIPNVDKLSTIVYTIYTNLTNKLSLK